MHLPGRSCARHDGGRGLLRPALQLRSQRTLDSGKKIILVDPAGEARRNHLRKSRYPRLHQTRHRRRCADCDLRLHTHTDSNRGREYEANRLGILIFDPATHEVFKTRPCVANIYAQIDGPRPPGLKEIVRHRTPALCAAKAAGIGLNVTVVAAQVVFGFFRGRGGLSSGS